MCVCVCIYTRSNEEKKHVANSTTTHDKNSQKKRNTGEPPHLDKKHLQKQL